MDVPNSASLGAMDSLLGKLGKLLDTEDGAAGIRQLRDGVVSIRTKLVKLSEVHDPPLTVNYWMKDARELSYDMEDCADQFVHADSDSKMDLIDQFKTRVEDVRERYDRFNLEYVLSHSNVTNTVTSHRLRTVYGEKPTPVGMEGPTHDLLRLLKPKADDENELQLKVVSILGVEGIGKSTLAQELWRKLEGEFECRAFVQTAKKPDMRMILRSLLLQVRQLQQPQEEKEEPPEACKVPNLIHDIRKHLQDKRYFIIIDDLCSVPVWDVVSRAFPEGNCCSRIIITTTIEDVGLACCSYDPEHIFRMEPLRDDHSKELFIRTVFGSGKECPQQFLGISDEITRKCGGLPLAIICIATLVSRQPETEKQWESVQNFLRHNLRTTSTFAEVLKQVLKLCYSSLPHCVKTCLLYLSIYPENYIIPKEAVVKQWIAEGFICITEGKDSLEVGRSYFDELVSLGLIQQIDSKSKKKRLSYAVHPVVFDFITCKSIEDNFMTIIDYSQSTVALTEKIRRLSLHFGSATCATTPECIELSQVRSLTFMGLLGCTPSLRRFKLVRVVILHLRGDDGDMRFSLAEIGGLLLLRYLQVRCNVTVELPDQMQGLKHLETLEIIAGVENVPSDIVHHSSLQHVRIGRKTKNKPLALGHTAIFPDVSSSSSEPSRAFQVFELLPPICSFSRLPGWTEQLRGLRILETVVRELWANDVDFLAGLPALTDLSLYVRKPSAGNGAGRITFCQGAFPALEYFKLVSGVLLLSFGEKAVPNLRRLKIGFNVHRGEEYSSMLDGIQHLINLQEVAASIGVATGAEESDRIAAKSAILVAFSKHPFRPKVKRVGPIDEECDPLEIQNWNQETESSNKRDEVLNKHSETQKEDSSIEQSRNLGKLITEDSTCTPPPQGDKDLSSQAPSASAWRQSQIVVGPLSVFVLKLQGKLQALLEQKHEQLSGLCVKISLLKDSLKFVHNYESINYNEPTRDFFNRYRELAYDIEDWADLFTFRIAGDRGGNPSFKFFGWSYGPVDKFTTLPPRRTISHEIQTLMERVRILESQGSNILCEQNFHSVPWRVDPPCPLDYNPSSLVGHDGPMEEVIKMFMNARDMAEFKIISIVGMAGSGKTTLAAAAYQRLRGEFDSCAFVSVGQEGHVVSKTLKDMLWQLDMGHQLESHDITQLIVKLRELLNAKRYLVVVDDLWSREHWETIKYCFPENNLHSRIIITTRNDALATNCSFGSSDFVYKIGLLSDAESKSLFLKKVFGEHGCPQHLEDVSAKIMRKCAGLPLAIVSVAAMLARNESRDEWERLGFNLLSSSDADNMIQRLNLSYNDLPPNLNACMLYLSIFPEYYLVDVECLVRRWIAEGFIGEVIGSRMEEIARIYLDGLISRNMVQPLHVNHDGAPKYCRVHPVIHDFIVYKSMEENFVTIVNAQHQDAPTDYSIVRRLSIQSSIKKNQAVARSGFMKLSLVRSVIVFGQASTPPHLTDLRLLRVLDLEGCDGPVCLDGLHKLLLLRYLSLRGTDVSELPETIGELRCLQTLDVRSTNVEELPSSIVRLEKLMHLLCGKAKLPRGISKMKALQTLSCALVTNRSTSIIQELVELVDLWKLELFCDFTQMPGHEKQVTFPGDGYRGLKQLCIRRSSPSVTFEPGVLPMVEVLELKFERGLAEESGGVSGIEHLLSLKHVLLEFSQDDAGVMATIDAVRKAADAAHPNHPEVTVNVDGRPLG